MEQEKYFIDNKDLAKFLREFDIIKASDKNKKFEKVSAQKKLRNHTGLPLMEQCQLILGKRMTEKRGVGYLLDGVHVSCDRIIKEAKPFRDL